MSWRERARVANPNTPRRFVYWARYLHSKGRNAAALRELDRRLVDAPGDPEALALRRAIVDDDIQASMALQTAMSNSPLARRPWSLHTPARCRRTSFHLRALVSV